MIWIPHPAQAQGSGFQKEADCQKAYFGLTATMFGGAGVVPSLFLKLVATWSVSVPPTRSIRSTLLVPATPTQAVVPSMVRPPLNGSVAAPARVIAPATPPETAVSTLLVPAGSTTIGDATLVGTRSWCAVTGPTPKSTN